MITNVKAKKPYVSECGDLWWGDKEVNKWLQAFTKLAIACRHRLLLSAFMPNPWDALISLGVSAKVLEQRFECPITGFDFWGAVPYALWVKRIEPYRAGRTGYPYAYGFDTDWCDHMHPYKPGEIPNIHDKMLGLGYTDGCHPSDGHGRPIELLAPLENGDFLHLFVWEWYNK